MFYLVSIDAINGGEPREVVFVLEANYRTLTALGAALRDDGFITGFRHHTKMDGSGCRVLIKDRTECLITNRSLRQVSVLRDRVVTPGGVTVFDAGRQFGAGNVA